MKPHIMETMHMLNTPRLSLFLPSPNRMTALNMPAETKGMSRLAVCTIKSAEPYCSFVSTRVYKGIRRNTNALEAKVPIANTIVLESSFLYLSILPLLYIIVCQAKKAG